MEISFRRSKPNAPSQTKKRHQTKPAKFIDLPFCIGIIAINLVTPKQEKVQFSVTKSRLVFSQQIASSSSSVRLHPPTL
ncbi:MAG: hypothetical protein CMM01_12430 [Rhodopirellula sp.]|nr:hypothetical protein [Rhodopirellula sp.]OUX51019.1 MAG: hypothetical protein CBE43_05180 [Rhodopirellula sp. TMED283]